MTLHGEAAWICLMCCNADVLFSVLVLHWVTSKDSTSVSSSAKSHTPPTNSKSPRNRLGSFDIYSKSGSRNVGTVTTHISALKSGKEYDEVDIGDIEMGGITVKVGQVVEVERDVDVDMRSVEKEGDVRSVEGERSRSHRSTEDLVERVSI
jgi:hypothetical protein